MVNFLSSFHRDLRKHLKLMYELQRKRKDINRIVSKCFDYMKKLVITPLILHTPTTNMKFKVENHTCKTAAGMTQYQFQ